DPHRAPDDPRGSGTRRVGGAEDDGIVVRRPETDGRRPKTAGPVTFGRSPLHLGRRARRGTSAVADKGGDAAPSSPPSSAPARLVRPARPPARRPWWCGCGRQPPPRLHHPHRGGEPPSREA